MAANGLTSRISKSRLDQASGIFLVTIITVACLSTGSAILFNTLSAQQERRHVEKDTADILDARAKSIVAFMQSKIDSMEAASVLPTNMWSQIHNIDLSSAAASLQPAARQAVICGLTARFPHSKRQDFEQLITEFYGVNGSVSELDGTPRVDMPEYEMNLIATTSKRVLSTGLRFWDINLLSAPKKEIDFADSHGFAISLPRPSPAPVDGISGTKVITIYHRIVNANSSAPQASHAGVAGGPAFESWWTQERVKYAGSTFCLFSPENLMNVGKYSTSDFTQVIIKVQMRRESSHWREAWRDSNYNDDCDIQSFLEFQIGQTFFKMSAHLTAEARDTRSSATARTTITVIIAAAPVLSTMIVFGIWHKQRSKRKFFDRLRFAESRQDAMRQFLFQTSHDMRTPLQALLSLVDEMLEGDSGVNANDSLKLIASCAELLHMTVCNVLDASLIQRKTFSLQEERLHMPELLEDTIAILKRSTHAKNDVRMRFVAPTGDFPALVGDAGRIKRMVMNLVANAMKATVKGGVDIFLDCMLTHPSWLHEPGDFVIHKSNKTSISQDTELANLDASKMSDKQSIWMRIRVVDSGPGIPEPALKKLASNGVSFDTGIVSVNGSLGIGLHICRAIAEKSQGGVLIQTSSQGTHLTVMMNMALAKNHDEVDVMLKPGHCSAYSSYVSDPCLTSDDSKNVCRTQLDHCSVEIEGSSWTPETQFQLTDGSTPAPEPVLADHDVASHRQVSMHIQQPKQLDSENFSKTNEPCQRKSEYNGIATTPSSVQSTILVPYEGVEQPTSSAEPETITIAVIEDTDMVRQILCKNLAKLSMVAEVLEASDGVQGLKLLKERHGILDVVISDIFMPEMCGDKMLCQFRKWEKENNLTPLPAFALTANANVDDFKQYLEAGFDQVLAKPIRATKLKELVTAIISRRIGEKT